LTTLNSSFIFNTNPKSIYRLKLKLKINCHSRIYSKDFDGGGWGVSREMVMSEAFILSLYIVLLGALRFPLSELYIVTGC